MREDRNINKVVYAKRREMRSPKSCITREMPRSELITTRASNMNSTKIIVPKELPLMAPSA